MPKTEQSIPVAADLSACSFAPSAAAPERRGFAGRPIHGITAPLQNGFEIFLDRVFCLIKDQAAAYADQNTLTFIKEARRLEDRRDPAFEKLLGLIDGAFQSAVKLRAALGTLAGCAWLEEAGESRRTDEVAACVEILERSRIWAEHPAPNGRALSSLIEDAVGAVVERLAARLHAEHAAEESDRARLIDLTRGAGRDFVRSVAALGAFCRTGPGPQTHGRTQLEEHWPLEPAKLLQLEALARAAPRRDDLLRSAAGKGGVIVDDYYTAGFFDHAQRQGARLITHWGRPAEGAPAALTGFLLYKEGALDLLCVNAKTAAVGTVQRLLDRLVIELQGSGRERCDAEIMGLNWSSFRVAAAKGWVPESIPSAEDLRRLQRGRGGWIWIGGYLPITPAARAFQRELTTASLRLLERAFQTQARRGRRAAASDRRPAEAVATAAAYRKEALPKHEVLTGFEGRIEQLRVLPDGRLLAGGGMQGRACVWQPSGQGARLSGVLKGHHLGASAFALGPSGAILSGSMGGEIYLWKLTGPDRYRRTAIRARSSAACTGVSAIEYLFGIGLVTLEGGGMIKQWRPDARGRWHAAVAAKHPRCACLAITPDGGLAVSGGIDGSLKVWAPRAEGPWRRAADLGGHHIIGAVAAECTGRFFVSGDMGGEVLVWKPDEKLGWRAERAALFRAPATQVKVTPAGDIAVNARDGAIHMLRPDGAGGWQDHPRRAPRPFDRFDLTLDGRFVTSTGSALEVWG